MEFKDQIREVLQIEAELQIEIVNQEETAANVRTFISGLTGSDLGTDALTSLLGGARAVDPFGLGGATNPLGQAENVIDTFFGTDVDLFGGLRETLETARETFDAEGTDAAFQDFITANNNFYEAVIEALRVIGRDTGQDLQPLIGLISGEQQQTGNQARLSPTAPETTAASTGASTAEVPTLRALTDVQSAYIQSLGYDPSIYGYDSRRNAFIKTAGGEGPTLIYDDSVAFEDSQAPGVDVTGGESETTQDPFDGSMPPELQGFFSFNRDQRNVLAPLHEAVNTAQDALDFIEDDLNASPEDRIAAYTALANAESALYAQQVSFVENATDITDEARANVLSVLQSNFNEEIREANDDLVDSLEEIGVELVNALTFTSGILTDSALAVRQIPLDVQNADTATEAETPAELADFFSFDRGQRNVLSPLQEAVNTAQDALDALGDDASAEDRIAAYTELANAESALYAQQVSFVENATDITDEARANVLSVLQSDFNEEIRDANDDLVSSLEDIGVELITALTFTSGILTDTALAVRQTPQMVEDQMPEIETEPEAEADPLRTVFRFSGEQRNRLTTLGGDIDEAEDAIRALSDDSTPEQVAAAYQALAAAEQAYYDAQIGFIEAGEGIFTDTALMEVREQAGDRLRGVAFDANNSLVRVLDDIGFELTTTFDATTGFLSNIVGMIQQIPEMVDDQMPEIEAEPETDDPLRTVFRLSGEQRDRLTTLGGDIDTAEDAIRALTDDSTPEQVTAAYTALAAAEQAYYQQEIAFIDAGVGIFTDTALMNRREQASNNLRGAAFDANRDLASALDDIGFELTTTFDATTGFLSNIVGMIQQIPQMVDDQMPEIEAEPEAAEPLRDVFRLSGAQRDALTTLGGGISTAEDAIRALSDDSTPEQVAAAYMALGTAEQAYYDAQIGFIEAGEGIFTDTALMNARQQANERLRNNAFDANNSLVRVLDDIGFELTTTFDATTGFLSNVIGVIQQIPQMVDDAVTDATAPP